MVLQYFVSRSQPREDTDCAPERVNSMPSHRITAQSREDVDCCLYQDTITMMAVSLHLVSRSSNKNLALLLFLRIVNLHTYELNLTVTLCSACQG